MVCYTEALYFSSIAAVVPPNIDKLDPIENGTDVRLSFLLPPSINGILREYEVFVIAVYDPTDLYLGYIVPDETEDAENEKSKGRRKRRSVDEVKLLFRYG